MVLWAIWAWVAPARAITLTVAKDAAARAVLAGIAKTWAVALTVAMGTLAVIRATTSMELKLVECLMPAFILDEGVDGPEQVSYFTFVAESLTAATTFLLSASMAELADRPRVHVLEQGALVAALSAAEDSKKLRESIFHVVVIAILHDKANFSHHGLCDLQLGARLPGTEAAHMRHKANRGGQLGQGEGEDAGCELHGEVVLRRCNGGVVE